MYSINFKSVLTLAMLVLMTMTSGCAIAGPELRAETFFEIPVHADQTVTLNSPTENLTITGPDVITFDYDGATGELYINNQGRTVRFLPWENFPNEYPTPEQIAQLQSYYTVTAPYIEQELSGYTNPDLDTWFSAFRSWKGACKDLENQARLSFVDNPEADRFVAATTASQPIVDSELVEPGSVEIIEPNQETTEHSITLLYRGGMRDQWGTPVRTMVLLSENYNDEPATAPKIDREGALVIHHALFFKLDTREPMEIDLSSGFRTKPAGR